MPNVRLPRRRFLALSAASLGGTLLTAAIGSPNPRTSKRVFPRRSGLLIASSGCLAAGMRSRANSPPICRRCSR
jgi:hypothetical protein